LINSHLPIPLKNSIMPSDTVYKSNSHGAFEKLNGDNFPAWKAAMIFHLGAEQGNLLAITTGELEEPPPENVASLENYRLRQRQAASTIAGACAPIIKPVVGHLYQDPARMWQILHSNYDSSLSASGRQTLRKTFDEAAPERGKPLGEFIIRLETIQRQLAFSAQSIDDDTFIAQFLRKLPEEFRMEVKMLQMMEHPSRDHVLRTIRQTEINQHMEASSSNTSSSMALYTAVPSSGPSAPRPPPGPPSYRGGRGNARGISRNFQGPYRGGNQNRARPGRSSRSIANPLIRQATATTSAASCRHCSQPGHSGSNCPSMQCWECGELGHGRSTCPLSGMPGSAEQQRRGFEAFQRYQAEHPRTGQANLSQGNADTPYEDAY
jgi:hypothetical protein